jgi:hypothetical protein
VLAQLVLLQVVLAEQGLRGHYNLKVVVVVALELVVLTVVHQF